MAEQVGLASDWLEVCFMNTWCWQPDGIFVVVQSWLTFTLLSAMVWLWKWCGFTMALPCQSQTDLMQSRIKISDETDDEWDAQAPADWCQFRVVRSCVEIIITNDPGLISNMAWCAANWASKISREQLQPFGKIKCKLSRYLARFL